MLGLFNFLRFNYTYDSSMTNDGLSSLPISANIRMPHHHQHDMTKTSYKEGYEPSSASSMPIKVNDLGVPLLVKQDSISSSKKNRVTFSNKCKVILVPTRAEYAAAGVDLWHKEGVIVDNRKELKQQLDTYMNDNNMLSCSAKEALKMVIQNTLDEAENMDADVVMDAVDMNVDDDIMI